jgi:hypothetical protein
MALPFQTRLWIDIARTMLPESRAMANARTAVERDRVASRQRALAEAALDRAARRSAVADASRAS